MEKAVWSNAHMNDLPDSAFLYIESGGKKDESGKTVPRSLRHFPYRGMNGKIDLAHTRNAIARIPQSKCGLSEQQKVALQNKARKYLGGKEMEKAMFHIDLEKAGQVYYGPKGGKYRDPAHKQAYKEGSDKKQASGKEWPTTNHPKVDAHAVNELSLHAENTQSLYQQRKAFEKNVVTKISQGKYNPGQANKLWMYFADRVAKDYQKEYGGNFDKQTRQAFAHQLAREFEEEVKNNPNDYKEHVPKKYQDKWGKSLNEETDLQKGNPIGGKYKQRIPKPGGGYRYIYEDAYKPIRNLLHKLNRNKLNSIDDLHKLGGVFKHSSPGRDKNVTLEYWSFKEGDLLRDVKHDAVSHKPISDSWSDFVKSLNKGMKETEILETFLKSTIEDESLPVIGKGKEQGDQVLDGKGRSSGNPGNGSATPDRGVAKPSVKKLSEDDEVDEKNMKDHKKPIENTARKSLNLSTQAHDYMAREVALRKAQLMKNDMVYIEPDEPVQKSIENARMTSDEMAVRSMQDESFYKAHLINRPLSGISLSTVNKCRHCSNTFSKAITVCPNCGRM